MATGQRVDPYSGFNFLVEIEGITRAAFQEVSGLDATIEVTEYREGGELTNVRKLPGLTTYSNVVLKRGVTDDRDLYDWHRAAVGGDVQRQTGSVVLLDRRGEEVARWNFREAWPTKWEGPALNATANEVAIETLELAHEGIERA